jgi:hypothetical protein
MSLRARLLALFLLFAVVPLLALGGIIALSLTDGRRTELVRSDHILPYCEPVGPGGTNARDPEFLYRSVNGNRIRLHAIRVGGASRLIGEIPAATVGTSLLWARSITE